MDWPRQQILTALQEDSRRLGRPPRAVEWEHAAPGRPTRRTVYRQFGTWTNAILEAGMTPAPAGVTWTRETILAALQDHARAHGCAPCYSQWRQAAPNHPSAETVSIRFGSWGNALHAAGLNGSDLPQPAAASKNGGAS